MQVSITCSVRASRWQNPYSPRDYSLETSLKLYEEHLTTSGLVNEVNTLKNSILGCWCENKDLCHGRIILEAIDNIVVSEVNDPAAAETAEQQAALLVSL